MCIEGKEIDERYFTLPPCMVPNPHALSKLKKNVYLIAVSFAEQNYAVIGFETGSMATLFFFT